MWDVWFGCDANYFNTQSTPNDSYSSIDTKSDVAYGSDNQRTKNLFYFFANLWSLSKIGHDFSDKGVLKLKLPKNVLLN